MSFRENYYKKDDSTTASSSGYVKQLELLMENHPDAEHWVVGCFHVHRVSGTGTAEGTLVHEDADLVLQTFQTPQSGVNWDPACFLSEWTYGDYSMDLQFYVRLTS